MSIYAIQQYHKELEKIIHYGDDEGGEGDGGIDVFSSKEKKTII